MSANKIFSTALLSVGLSLCLLLAGKVAAEEMSPHQYEIVEAACQQTHNVSTAELEEIPRDVLPDDVDMKFKCYAHCILEGLDFLDEGGKLDVEKLHPHDDEMRESIMDCKAANDVKEDPCEYSFGLLVCTLFVMPSSESVESDSAADES